MDKAKLLLLNICCAVLFICIAALCWKNLVRSTIVSDCDYTTFLKTLTAKSDFYKTYSFLKISHQKIIDDKQVATGQKISLINMNTPLMSLLLHSQINSKESLEKNALHWTLLSLFCLITCTLLLQIQIHALRSPLLTIPIATLLLLSWQSLIVFKMGQVTLFLLPLLFFGYVLDQKKEARNVSVLILAFLASLKLFFLLFLVLYAVRHEWRLCIRFMLAVLLFSLMPLLFLPHVLYAQFFALAANHTEFLTRASATMNASLLSVFAFTLSSSHFSTQTILHLSELFSTLCMIAFIFYDQFFIRTLKRHQDDLRFAFITVLALICSPLAWEYYFLFLLLPIFIIIKMNQTTHFSKSLFALLLLSLILPTFEWVPVLQGIFHLSGFFSLILFLCLLHHAARAVRNDSAAVTQQAHLFLCAFLLNVLISCFMFHFNYGTQHFF